MSRPLLALGSIFGALVLATAAPVRAADVPLVPAGVTHQAHDPVPVYCGPCGCLQVVYVYHRELRSTYGLAFDPRNDDTTEPQYYFGPPRAYPRYFVDGVPVPGSCD
jgi:hypothetical protein